MKTKPKNFTPKDIVIGAKYKNNICQNVVFLGAGLRNPITGKESNKKLIIIEANECYGKTIGHQVHSTDKYAPQSYWNNFSVIK